MAKQLFSGITFFFDRLKTPVKHRNISNLEKHTAYIVKNYNDAHYTNYYTKQKKSFHGRVYHKTKEDLFTWLKSKQ